MACEFVCCIHFIFLKACVVVYVGEDDSWYIQQNYRVLHPFRCGYVEVGISFVCGMKPRMCSGWDDTTRSMCWNIQCMCVCVCKFGEGEGGGKTALVNI